MELVERKKEAALDLVNAPSEELRPQLLKTLETLQFLRTAKGKDDSQIHPMLEQAYNECIKDNLTEVLFKRLIIHVGDVSRKHNILKAMGVKSDNGGAQEREVFRSIIRFLNKKDVDMLVSLIPLIPEFTVYENLMYYELRSDRFKGYIKTVEVCMPCRNVVHEFLASKIRSNQDLQLIARHLPKYETGQYRTTKKKIRPRKGVTSFKWRKPDGAAWAKLNGVLIDGEVEVKEGDIVSYPRKKQAEVINKQTFVNGWIKEFCKEIGWSIKQYNDFRSKQSTPEQKFSSKDVLKLSKSEFIKFLDSLTSGQRFRVACMVCNKDTSGNLVPVVKWKDLGKWYIEWEANQTRVMEEVREAFSSGDKEKLEKAKKKIKVKATGMQTIDILNKLFESRMTDEQLDNTHQALIEKMDLIANVFVVIDGSGSMSSSVKGNHYNYSQNGPSCYDVASTIGITFSTRNPNLDFRNTFGWFSSQFNIVGQSKFVNDAPNPYVDRNHFQKRVNTYNVLSEKNPFSVNYRNMRNANPGIIQSTNMGSVFEYFIGLVQNKGYHVEDLPVALLFITDGEYNSGISPSEAMRKANAIGWFPLIIFWCIKQIPSHAKKEMETMNNTILVGGYSESVLSQILRGIKTGSVNPQTELWTIFEDKRYSMIK